MTTIQGPARIEQWATNSHSFRLVQAEKDSTVGPILRDRPFLSLLISGKVQIKNGYFGHQLISPGTFAIYYQGLAKDATALQSNTRWAVIEWPRELQSMARVRKRTKSCERFDHPNQIAKVVKLIGDFSIMTDDREWDFVDQIDQLFVDHVGFEYKKSKCPNTVLKLQEFIHSSRHEYIGLDETAVVLGRNASHLARAFKRHFGLTIGAYLRLLRFRDAFFALTNSNLPLADIAFQFGFSDQSHMCRTFKSISGFTPRQIKCRHRSVCQPAG